MSDPTAQEPTMEEILASIRRIISEDDAPAAEPPPPAPAPAPVQVAEPPPPPPPPPIAPAPAAAHPRLEEEDDVLELTEPAPAPTETHGDIDVFAPPAPPAPEPVRAAPPPQPVYAPSFSAEPEEDSLLSGGAQDKAAMHFGLLSQSIAMPAPGRTLEDLVRELLRPLLKEWLDQHLPTIVEDQVRAEVERISRRRVP